MTTLNQLLIAEATEYEFKSAVEANKPRSWLRTVSAFANGVGGSIYFGVSDVGTVVGLENPQRAAEQVSELIKARIEPAIDDTLTFVGALFTDQCPIYQSRVFCTHWNGLKKGGLYVDALDSDEFQGNAISLFTDALKFVRHNSSVKWKKTGTGRIEKPDYPPEAIHEALVNALVHRDYMIQGSEIHVDMYEDRLEIVSPGGMPDGKRIQDLNIDDVASIRRNPVICDIFSRLKLMEAGAVVCEKSSTSIPKMPRLLSAQRSNHSL